MLPAGAYLDPAVLEWERAILFAGGWQCVGRASDVAKPRSRKAVAVGDDAVLLVRGDDGEVRAFFNTCAHRAHELLPCGATADSAFIACPYHNWVFNLKGELHKVPAGHRDRDDMAGIGLAPAPLAEWQGFLFVNVDGHAEPVGDYFAGLDELLAPYELDRLVVAASHDYELQANWKLAIENYQECYHCSSIHPELTRVSPPESGGALSGLGLWVGGTMELSDGVTTMSLDGLSGGAPMRRLSGRQLREVVYLQLMPNLLLSVHPDYVMTHLLTPLAPDRTAVECQWLFPPETVAREGFSPAYAVDFWDITNRQDWDACEGVQRGVGSRGYRPGPLSTWHESEVFQAIAVVARAYLDGRLPTSAAAALSHKIG